MQEQDAAKRERYRQKMRMKKRRRITVLIILAIILFFIVFGLVKLLSWIFAPKYITSANIGPLPPAEGDSIVVMQPPVYYDYSVPVPLSTSVEDSYFSDVLMIGDARVAGFPLFGYLPKADCLASEGISVDKIKDYNFDVNGISRTLREQLASKPYKAIYIQVGLNELGWENNAAFYKSYSELVEIIKNAAPGASIYLQGIIPITSGKSGSPSYLTNEKIAESNSLIKQIAEEKKVYYLDVTEGMSNGTGVLLSGYAASNGLSLTREGYNKWIEYLKTHVVDKEKYS